MANTNLFLQPAHGFVSENCFEEYPAGGRSLVSPKVISAAEGKDLPAGRQEILSLE